MKKSVLFLIVVVMLLSAGNKGQTIDITYSNQSDIAKMSQKITDAPDNGYLMRAKIDGKPWQSTSMADVAISGRIVGYCNGQYIGLPYSKNYLVAGKKILLDEGEAADLFLKDGCSYAITKGQIEITKAGDNWAEGTFYFSTVCSSSGKTVKITDGFFRILVSNK
jgi:hypothetical protein